MLTVWPTRWLLHTGISSTDMQEQLEAKLWEAHALADNKQFVAAAVLVTECVALAENCRISASQRKELTEFHEFVEHMVMLQQAMASCKFHPRYQQMHSMQSGSSDAGNAAFELLRLGQVKHSLGDWEGALKDLTQANKLNSESSTILQIHDAIKQELQDGACSKEASQQQHAPSALAVSLGLWAKQDAAVQKEIDSLMSQSEYQRAQWLPPSHCGATAAAQLVLRVANLKHLASDFRGAAADLITAEHLQPGDVATLQLRGSIRMKLCDYSGAAEDLSNTADSAELLKLRGTARFCVGQIEGAFADIARADSLDPGLADKFTEMLEKAFEKYGDPAEEYMAGQIAALKAMLKDTHNA